MSTMTEELTYCEVHPDRETALRCNKCGRLMCADCAVSTPVGYRCKQCVRQHEDKFFNAGSNDYALLFGVCAALSGVGGFLASAIGFILLWVIGSIPAGGFISEVALRATKRRRGRYSGEVGAAGVVVGGFLGGLLHAYTSYSASLELLIRATLPNIGMWIFIGVVAAFVYQRFRMR